MKLSAPSEKRQSSKSRLKMISAQRLQVVNQAVESASVSSASLSCFDTISPSGRAEKKEKLAQCISYKIRTWPPFLVSSVEFSFLQEMKHPYRPTLLRQVKNLPFCNLIFFPDENKQSSLLWGANTVFPSSPVS